MSVNLKNWSLYLILCGMIVAPAITSAQEIVDSVCAIVDDEIILESEVGYGVSSVLLERAIRRPTESQLMEARTQVLEA